MGDSCSMHVSSESAFKILVEKLQGRDHLDSLGIYGRLFEVDLKEMGREDVDGIHVVQCRDWWLAVVKP